MAALGATSMTAAMSRPLTSRSLRSAPVRRGPLSVRAERAKNVPSSSPPAGVKAPTVQPQLSEPTVGFTTFAETINSRLAMLGFIAIFPAEAVLQLLGRQGGVLALFGFDVGNGIDIGF